MKHKLSFCSINILTDTIAEVIVNKNIVMSLEMVEEYHKFLVDNFKGDFGILVNKINQYHYSFEAKLTIASASNIKAMAVINYNQAGKKSTEELLEVREQDSWNLKSFSGLDLGWQQGFEWLEKELSTISR